MGTNSLIRVAISNFANAATIIIATFQVYQIQWSKRTWTISERNPWNSFFGIVHINPHDRARISEMYTQNLDSSVPPRDNDSASAVPVPSSGANILTSGSSDEPQRYISHPISDAFLIFRECPLRALRRQIIQAATAANYSPLQFFFGYASKFLKSSLTRRISIRFVSKILL
jgi:hypothetical protein